MLCLIYGQFGTSGVKDELKNMYAQIHS